MFMEVCKICGFFFHLSDIWKPLLETPLHLKDQISSFQIPESETPKITLALGVMMSRMTLRSTTKMLKDILGGAIGIPYCSSKKTHTNRLHPWISESFICSAKTWWRIADQGLTQLAILESVWNTTPSGTTSLNIEGD